jgi:hypothetical protein
VIILAAGFVEWIRRWLSNRTGRLRLAGKSQISITPNLIVGTIPIYRRLGISVGLGYQLAVSPRVPTFDRNWILSVRLSF